MAIQLFILLMLYTPNNYVEFPVMLTLSFQMLAICVLLHFFHDSSNVQFINFIDIFNGAIFAFVGIFYSLLLFFINLHSNLCHFHGFAIR